MINPIEVNNESNQKFIEFILILLNREGKFILFFCNIIKEGIKNAGIFNQIENSIGILILKNIWFKNAGNRIIKKDKRQNPIALKNEIGCVNVRFFN